MTAPNLVTSLIVGCLLLTPRATAGPPAPLPPAPLAGDVEHARRNLREDILNREEFRRATQPADKRALAARLGGLVPHRTEPAEVFAVLDEIRRLSAEGGDVKRAYAACAELDRRFQHPTPLDARMMDTLRVLAASPGLTPADASHLTHLADFCANVSWDRREYAGAARFTAVAAAAAEKAGNPALAAAADRGHQTAEFVRQSAAALAINPNNPTANTVLGRFLTVGRGDWEAGLGHLLGGGDPEVAGAAKLDLANPRDAAERQRVGDAWFELGRKSKSDREAYWTRAADWYELARPAAASPAAARRAETAAAFPELVGGRQLARHDGPVVAITFSPDTRAVATAGGDKTVRVWSLRGGEQTARFDLPGDNDTVLAPLAFAPNGRYLAAGTALGKTVRVWDLDPSTGAAPVATLGPLPDWVRGLAFTPDGGGLVGVLNGVAVRVWDTHGYAPPGRGFPARDGANGLFNLAVGTDGRMVAVAQYSGYAVRVLDLNGKERVSLAGHAAEVHHVGFSRDGRVIATAGTDATARVWDVGRGAETRKVSAANPSIWFSAVALNPDGRVLATCSHPSLAINPRSTVQLWNVSTGEEVRRVEGHHAEPPALAFSPDGRWLAAPDPAEPRAVRVWRVSSLWLRPAGPLAGPAVPSPVK